MELFYARSLRKLKGHPMGACYKAFHADGRGGGADSGKHIRKKGPCSLYNTWCILQHVCSVLILKYARQRTVLSTTRAIQSGWKVRNNSRGTNTRTCRAGLGHRTHATTYRKNTNQCTTRHNDIGRKKGFHAEKYESICHC